MASNNKQGLVCFTVILGSTLVLLLPKSAQGGEEFLIKLNLDGESLPRSINIEDVNEGVSAVAFDPSEECYPVSVSVPEYGDGPTTFTVVIPWMENNHNIFFRLTSGRDPGEFQLQARLRRLPTKVSSVAELEQMGVGLQANLERYLWARDLFKRAERTMAKNHIVTVRALRQWFDANFELVKGAYDLFGLDPDLEKTVRRYEDALGGDATFRRVNLPGYFESMMSQARFATWLDVDRVAELVKEGEIAAAYKLNEQLVDSWHQEDESSRKLVTEHYSVTLGLLEENRSFLHQRLRATRPH